MDLHRGSITDRKEKANVALQRPGITVEQKTELSRLVEACDRKLEARYIRPSHRPGEMDSDEAREIKSLVDDFVQRNPEFLGIFKPELAELLAKHGLTAPPE